MLALIKWFDGHSGFTMALLTAVYVGATLWIVRESRRTNRLQGRLLAQQEALERARKRPYVIFSIDFERVRSSRHDTLIYAYAKVRNVGLTSAHSVVVQTSPPLKGRLGIDADMRVPAIVGSKIAFMPPNHEVKDLVSLSKFLFEDHKDEELCFTVSVAYTDSNGEAYSDEYVIDVAAQKEARFIDDAEESSKFKAIEHIERASTALTEIARILGAPDRSLLSGSAVANARLSREQKDILRELLAAAERSNSKLFFACQYVGDSQATIELVRGDASDQSSQGNLKAFTEDLEYLCRVGALHGHYSHGGLKFAITPLARPILESSESGE